MAAGAPPALPPAQLGISPTCLTKLRPLITREFTWAVDGLSLERMKACPPGSLLAGPTLELDGIEMFASLFCNGDGAVAETRDHACLDVMIRTPDIAVTVTDGLLWLLNAVDGTPVLSYEVNRNKVLGIKSDGTPMENAYLGFGFRLSHAQLAQHRERALASDTLVVKCRVTALASSLLSLDKPGVVAGPLAPPSPVLVPPPALAAGWAALLESGEGADVALTADGERFPAHRAVLAAHSPVLRARLLGALGGPPVPWPASDDPGALPSLAVDDVAPPVLAVFLRYLYSESFDADDAAVEEAQHLMVCADAHGCERLRLLCERRLAHGLDVPTAAYTLVLAEQHHARELKAAALAYVAQHAVEVMDTEGWEHLCAARPALQREVIKVLAMGLSPAGGASGGASGSGRATDGSDTAGRRVRQRHA